MCLSSMEHSIFIILNSELKILFDQVYACIYTDLYDIRGV